MLGPAVQVRVEWVQVQAVLVPFGWVQGVQVQGVWVQVVQVHVRVQVQGLCPPIVSQSAWPGGPAAAVPTQLRSALQRAQPELLNVPPPGPPGPDPKVGQGRVHAVVRDSQVCPCVQSAPCQRIPSY